MHRQQLNQKCSSVSSGRIQPHTFAEESPGALPLILVPALLPLIPLLFVRSGWRATVAALASAILAGFMFMGMTGYGLAFPPSSIALLIAAFAADVSRPRKNVAASP